VYGGWRAAKGYIMSHTVLLVDDEPHVLDGLQRALRKEPYLILTATSAAIALEILRTRAVDLVVSDYEMPGMHGTAFLAQVQQEFPEIMLFMLTGKATPEVAVQAINDGAISHFFTKPCDMAALAFTIRQTLHQRTSMTQLGASSAGLLLPLPPGEEAR
jgi:DNA-binding NtrC family response regulator